jgi:hypothetical protein
LTRTRSSSKTISWAGIDPRTDGRPDPRPDVRENEPILGTLVRDFDFARKPLPPLLLDPHPHSDLR